MPQRMGRGSTGREGIPFGSPEGSGKPGPHCEVTRGHKGQSSQRLLALELWEVPPRGLPSAATRRVSWAHAPEPGPSETRGGEEKGGICHSCSAFLMQIGLVNWTGGYLTCECYGDGVSVLGSSLGKKQVWSEGTASPNAWL